MNSIKFMQTDSRWSELGYPSYPCYVGRDGCGMVSVANCIIEMAQFAGENPRTMQPYCKQYAAPSCDGTYFAGIPAMMKHYGMTEVMEHDTMATLWTELAKGDRVAIYLMGSRPGGSKGVHWTSGGHFVCSVDYKYEGGDHMVYVKDSYSNSKDRNGWLGYKTHMKGDVSMVWSGKLNGSKPTPPSGDHYQGEYPNPSRYLELGDKGTEVTKLQNYIDWMFDGKFFKECGGADGIYGQNTLKWAKQMQKALGYPDSECDGKVGHNTIERMRNYSKKDKPTPPTPPKPTKHTDVLDISEFQPSIDFAKVKAAGIDGIMVRCGYRGYESAKLMEDSKFMEYIKGASKVGLKCGVYFFTEAINEAEGREEARYTIDLIKKSGVKLYYPVAVDTEAISSSARADKISKSARTKAIYGFCDEIKKHGGVPMIYASTSWFSTHLDMSKLPYKIWCAQYYKECQYKGEVSMWQYTSDGTVNGIKGVVDKNECYITSASPMPTPSPTPTPTGEHYTGEYPNPKRYLEYGDKGTEVGKLQDYLNWYTDGAFYKECGGRDNIYGKNTLRYTNKMLTDFFGASEADGKVGPKTIAKMKAYTKPVKPTPTPKPYSGTFPSEAEIRQASGNGIREGIRSWCYDIFKSGKYGYKRFENEPAPGFYCPICKPGTGNGWNCIGYSFASWKHGGGIPCNCNCGIIWNGLGDRYYDMSNIEVLKSMQSRIGTDDIKLIRNNNRAIPRTSLQMGDLLMFYRGSTYAHMGVYIGNGKVSDDANPSEGIRYGEPYEDFNPCLFAIRYTGTRPYLKLHDSGTAVAKWQDFLNWWSDGQFYKECGGVDGIFGSNTDKWTKKFQEAVIGKGQGDGLVGMKTITAAKKVVK